MCDNDIQYASSFESRALKGMPLYPSGGYGRSKITKVVNLSNNEKSLIVYACSHIVIKHDVVSGKKECLPGHKYAVSCLSSDSLGKLLTSSDFGEENSIIVWDLGNNAPFVRFKSPPRTYVTKISYCGKYVVSVSLNDGFSSCCVWPISKHNEGIAGIVNFNCKLGVVLDIAFSWDIGFHFMLTTKNTALFFTWQDKSDVTVKSENLEVYIPPAIPERLRNKLQESIYLEHYSTCFTSTSDGFILVWDDDENKFKLKKFVPRRNRKLLKKWYKLQNDGINVLRQLNECIITGDKKGFIRFYDYNLLLLYSTKGTHLDINIVQLEFHLEAREYDFKTTVSVKAIDQYTDKAIPTDCTREGNTFIIQDFIVVDQNGYIYYFDFLRDYCFKIFYNPKSPIIAMDVHPERPIITIGDSSGTLTKINYITGEEIFSKSVFEFTLKYNDVITCLKYSSSGAFISLGMRKGAAYLLDSCLYDPMQEKPFAFSSTKIIKICFSPDDQFMAYADEHHCISLCGFVPVTSEEKLTKRWIFCGKICLHFRSISDLKFDPLPTDSNRLFSIGWDRSLVEYSLRISENNGIGKISTDQIEQSAFPLSLTCSVCISGTRYLLVTNSEFKYKLYQQDTKAYIKTILGPVFDSPISYTVIESDELMIFGTNMSIGLQMLPVDGNPFKCIGVLAHPVSLKAIAYARNRRMLFTVGNNETCIISWRVNERSLLKHHQIGGKGLEPYYHLIEGGAKGSFLQLAKEYFCLSKIFHQGFYCQNQMDAFIDSCDIANVLRSLGCFPTDKEVEEILKEVSLNMYDTEKKAFGKISFEDFLLLYINHRPAKGFTSEQITSNLKILSEGGYEVLEDKLQDIFTQEGEVKSRSEISTYLQYLFGMEHSKPSLATKEGKLEDLNHSTFQDKILDFIKMENNLT